VAQVIETTLEPSDFSPCVSEKKLEEFELELSAGVAFDLFF
jgi:hypothetical protein